ncbi:MAG: alpha/beta hydrolase [Patescibacteria group bacterium]
MVKPHNKPVSDFIMPLHINGLQGRMLHMPAPAGKKREILLIYGHHASLERLQGLAEILNDYGAVTMPDLPGFGGMDSFYKIGQKATLDNFADYLATFIKMKYRRKHVTILGVSLGFVIATRMLQRFPDLTKKVDLLVSAVGFTHHDDFNFTPSRHRFYLNSARVFSHTLPATFFKNLCLNPIVLRLAYSKTKNAKKRFEGLSKSEKRISMNFEIHLWQCNDVRTYMAMGKSFLKLDNCKTKIGLPVWHINSDNDQYFDSHRIEQHMRIVFTDFHAVRSRLRNHGPSIILDKAEARQMLPPKIRQLLAEPT